MNYFDKNRKVKELNDVIGLPRDFDYDIDWAIKNKAIWGACSGFVSDIVIAILVGQTDDAVRLLAKAKHWIEVAMELREEANHFGASSHYFHRHLYCLILWLNDGIHEAECLAQWLSATVVDPSIHNGGVHAASLGLAAVTYLDAGAYLDYIVLAAPNGIESIKCSGANEKQMALTLAAQALTHKFPEDKVRASVKKFLDNHVGKWLNEGHAVRAAEWMKVIYWKRGEAGISPFDAVRKCLDHVECD